MYFISNEWLNAITAPARSVIGKVGLYKSSTLAATYWPQDKLVTAQIERTPTMGVFFGYTICQKATVVLLDKDKTLDVKIGDEIKVSLGNNLGLIGSPRFTIEEVTRDSVKKTIKIVAYDAINKAAKYKQGELNIEYPITLTQYAAKVAEFLGLELSFNSNNSFIDVTYTEETQPNFSGNETLREVLAAIAEASGTICYIDALNTLCFKQLNNYDAENTEYTIERKDYFSLSLGEPKALTEVMSVTNLGDNVAAQSEGGAVQVIRNNPFIVNREDIAEILEALLVATGGLVFYPYAIKWRGNPCFEIGDFLRLETESGYINFYYLGETIIYNGGLVATSEWKDEEQQREAATSTTLGAVLNETYAKVDKVNKEIELLIMEDSINESRIASLELTTDTIAAKVESVEKSIDNNASAIGELTKQVEATMSAEDVRIEISTALNDGVSKVETSTGYTFNENGLSVSKSGSEMVTTITEDGMTVYKNDNEVLVANNEGVKAIDLHAETFLIVGKNSRFEDYKNKTRTACFWIGG